MLSPLLWIQVITYAEGTVCMFCDLPMDCNSLIRKYAVTPPSTAERAWDHGWFFRLKWPQCLPSWLGWSHCWLHPITEWQMPHPKVAGTAALPRGCQTQLPHCNTLTPSADYWVNVFWLWALFALWNIRMGTVAWRHWFGLNLHAASLLSCDDSLKGKHFGACLANSCTGWTGRKGKHFQAVCWLMSGRECGWKKKLASLRFSIRTLLARGAGFMIHLLPARQQRVGVLCPMSLYISRNHSDVNWGKTLVVY